MLWTRDDTGQANLWQIDPSLPTGPDQLKRIVSLYSATGVGAPWQATSCSIPGGSPLGSDIELRASSDVPGAAGGAPAADAAVVDQR